MVNGIPPVVSNRGALPDVIDGDATSGGGGLVRSVPEWMTPAGTRIPSEREVEPWFGAVCSLWDDAAPYEAVSTRGRTIAGVRYSEQVSRAKHVEYFTSLEPLARPFRSHTSPP